MKITAMAVASATTAANAVQRQLCTCAVESLVCHGMQMRASRAYVCLRSYRLYLGMLFYFNLCANCHSGMHKQLLDIVLAVHALPGCMTHA